MFRDIEDYRRISRLTGEDDWAGLDRQDAPFGANSPAVVPRWAIALFYGCITLIGVGVALAT